MNDHQHFISIAFRAVGCLIGLPSLLLFLDSGFNLILFALRPGTNASHPLDIGKYGLVGLLSNGVLVFSKALEGLSIVASWLMVLVAILALFFVAFAIFLYFTGTGIEAHAKWARIAGILLSVFLLVLSASAITWLPRHLIGAPCLTAAASVYGIWVLGWKFV